MIQLDFYEEAENSLELILKFGSEQQQPETYSPEESMPAFVRSDCICVTSAPTLIISSEFRLPLKSKHDDPVAELSCARRGQEQKLEQLWLGLNPTPRKSSCQSETGIKRQCRKRRLIAKPKKG